jgi:rRNA maturation RNase YbeY
MSTLAVEFHIVTMPGVNVAIDATRLEQIAHFVLQAEEQGGKWEVALVLTTDPHLRELHRDYMGIDSETDVMTFPTEPEPSEETQGGDIVVSVDRAREQAPLYDQTVDQEIEFLAVHGLLHLSGWDDVDPDDRAKMLGRQTELIQAFNRAETGQSAPDGERPRQ